MDWQQLRSHLLNCLGGSWPAPAPLNVQLRDTVRRAGYRIESLTYDAEPGQPIPALLLVPDQVSGKHPAPAVAVWHQHNGQWELGKSEPAGLAGDPEQHVGVQLVQRGYVVLCPDALCFEERRHEQLAGDAFERFEFLRWVVSGKSMAWKNILDMRRAVDFLCSRAEVDGARLGCFGHSMGATHCWLLGPWEPRIKCLVANCCLPTYAGIHRHHLLHCFPNFVPGFYQYGDTPDIAALTAPRPLLMNFGERDVLSPIEEVRSGVARIAAAYQQLGVPENFRYFIQADTEHCFSREMQTLAWQWLDTHLQGDAKYQAQSSVP